MNSLIDLLQDVQAGLIYREQGTRINNVNRILRALWRAENLGSSPTIQKKSNGPAGYTLIGSPLGSSTSSQVPFGVSVQADPNNPGRFLAAVNPDSTVMQSMRPNDSLGVLMNDGSPLGTPFAFTAADVVSLYMVVSNYAIVGNPRIQSYGTGTTTFDPTLAAWDPSDQSYVFDDGGTPPNQLGINILIAYAFPDSKGNPFVTQCQKTHVLLENGPIDGRPALYDYSHRERYPIYATT